MITYGVADAGIACVSIFTGPNIPDAPPKVIGADVTPLIVTVTVSALAALTESDEVATFPDTEIVGVPKLIVCEAGRALNTGVALFTVNVKLCTFAPTLLVAVMVMGYEPTVPSAGVPLSTPVVELSVTPLGSAPVSVKVGAGEPVAVTVNVPGVATVNVALVALVIAGGTPTVCGTPAEVLVR